MKRIVIGIDPGTGASSPTGFVAFDPESFEILHAEALTSKNKDGGTRLREIAAQASEIMDAIDPDLEVYVFIESFFIRGRGNQILQQVIGALKAASPARALVADVPNTTMKRVIGLHGKAEKQEIAKNLMSIAAYQNSASAHDQIGYWMLNDMWDMTDALAIGLCGWIEHKRKGQALGEIKRQTTKKKKR